MTVAAIPVSSARRHVLLATLRSVQDLLRESGAPSQLVVHALPAAALAGLAVADQDEHAWHAACGAAALQVVHLLQALAPAALTGASRGYLERNPDFAARIRSETPLGRLGDPREDIGRTLVALCSDNWNCVTGLTLMVDGGHYLAQ